MNTAIKDDFILITGKITDAVGMVEFSTSIDLFNSEINSCFKELGECEELRNKLDSALNALLDKKK